MPWCCVLGCGVSWSTLLFGVACSGAARDPDTLRHKDLIYADDITTLISNESREQVCAPVAPLYLLHIKTALQRIDLTLNGSKTRNVTFSLFF